jgi:hypothetical protein
MAKLGDLLVDAGLASREQVEEAHRAQLVHGGRLGTNLVELGAIDEGTLARFLAQQHGVLSLEDPNAEPDPAAVQLVPGPLCDQYDMIPYREDDGALQVLMVNPVNMEARRAAEEASGMPVQPWVIPEGRLAHFLLEFLGIERPLRFATVAEAARQQAGQELEKAGLSGILRDQAFVSPNAESGATSGGNLEEVIELSDVVEIPALNLDFEIDVDEPVGENTDADEFFAPLRTENFFVGGEAPTVANTAEAPSAPNVDDAVNAAVGVLDALDPTSSLRLESLPGDLYERVKQMHAALDEDQRPLTFAAAVEALQTASSGEEILSAVLRHCLSRFERAIAFRVQRNLAMGHSALGSGVDNDLVKKIMIPLGPPSMLLLAHESGRTTIGDIEDTAINRLFFDVLGGTPSQKAYVVPLRAGEQVVQMVYSDQPIESLSPEDEGELVMLAGQARIAYQRLFKAHGAQASRPQTG